MKLRVNGCLRETAVADLAAALVEFGYGDALVATALNGTFVPAGSRPGTTLSDGDEVEVLAPMKGG